MQWVLNEVDGGWRTALPNFFKIYRGLFSTYCGVLFYNPLALLGAGAALVSWIRNTDRSRAMSATLLGIICANLFFYCSLPSPVPPNMGSYGARYTVYSVLFSVLALGPWLQSLSRHPKFAGLIAAGASIPAWLYYFYGSPGRGPQEYFALFMTRGPSNYVWMKAAEGGVISASAPAVAWVGFLLLTIVSALLLRAKNSVK